MHRLSGLYLLTLILFFVLSSLVISGCDDDDDNDDDTADDDTGDDDTGDDDTDDDDDNTVWPNLSDQLGEGEVRAGLITAEDELIGGPRARGQIGDYKIYNSQVELIIRSPENPGIGWTTYSGNLVDADRARAPEEQGADGLWALEQLIGLIRGFYARDIEVVKSGADGQAIIRVTGKDGGIDIVDSTVPTLDHQLIIVNEYILDADKNYLRVRTTLENQIDKDRRLFLADIPLWDDEMKIFNPRTGYNMGDLDLLANLRWVGGISRLGFPVSYALATENPKRSLWAPYIDGEILPLIEGMINLAPFGVSSYERLFIIGDGDTGMISSTINAYDQNEDFVLLTGRIDTAAGGDLEGVEVIVTDSRPVGTNFVGVLWPDRDGEFSLEVTPGRYTLMANGPGRIDAQSVSLVADDDINRAELYIDSPGFFNFTVTDDLGAEVPCRITLQPGHNANPNAGIAKRIWSITGMGTERIVPGNYTATASRGYEYEIAQQNITIAAGQITYFEDFIEHSVDTTNHLSGDFHIHTQFSIDSQALADVRVRELVTEGIEMPVFTDHDFNSDFTPIVAAVGAEDLIKPVIGTEISPVYGHLNAWPMDRPGWAPDYYGVPLVKYSEHRQIIKKYEIPELWQIARSDFGAQVIQINHPRSDSLGWFNYVDYDPTVGVSPLDPALWSTGFDAIEVFNSGSNHEGSLTDWFSFLDQGLEYTLTGNSDSHSPDSNLGNPRNVFYMPTDDPALADPADMVDSILNHRNQVSNGPFISFSINGEPIGGMVSGETDLEANLQIKVQAPLWVTVDTLRIYSHHGQVIQQIDLPPTGNVVRFEGTISYELEQDAYFVVWAGSDTANLGPVTRGENPFCMTNPIWVDANGNGRFDPPGLP